MTSANLHSQIAVVTGGTDGIGKATALRLVRQGAQVILVGRNARKAEQAIVELRDAVPAAEVCFWAHDLALMREGVRLADAIAGLPKPLDMLVHCAGVMLPRRVCTSEGLETVFAVQYLSRFHLTRALATSGALAQGARVVNVSAAGQIPLRLDFGNLNGERFYNGLLALVHESVANDLFGMRFAALHPAFRYYNYGPFYVNTAMFAGMPWWFRLMTATMGPFVATTTDVAADAILRLLAGVLDTGIYTRKLRKVRPSRYLRDQGVQERLWQTSDRLVAGAFAQSR